MASTQILALLTISCLIALTTSHSINVRGRPGQAQGQGQYKTGAGVRLYAQEKIEPEEEYEIEEVSPVRLTQVKVPAYNEDSYQPSRPKPQQSQYSNIRLSEQRDHDLLAEEQAKSAQYSFASAVDDGIMDQSQVRQETRDGLKVTGSYSYSDGFYRRTVKYEADEKGYRVIEEDTEPIGEGPQTDIKNGKADIHTQVSGVDTIYSISSADIGQVTKEKVLKSTY